MNIKTLLVLIGLTLVNSFASACETESIPVTKGISRTDEPASFERQLVLPWDASQGRAERPRSIADGVEILGKGLDPGISMQSVAALGAACKGATGCDLSSPETWDRFIEASEKIEVEPGHSLSDYLFSLDQTLAREWALDEPCEQTAGICSEFVRHFHASSSVYAEVVLRSAIVKASGREWSFSSALQSMGDLVDGRLRK